MSRLARISSLVAALSLAGCPYPEVPDGCGRFDFQRDGDGDGAPAAEVETLSWCADAPPDGYVAASGAAPDCDDGEAAIRPGAVEACNGIDDDCDPATREDDDGDGDGFARCGAGGTPDDCDDAEAAVNPGATETPCNGIDDDCFPETVEAPDIDEDGLSQCDGDCDDADADVATEEVDGFLDADGDGYGEGEVASAVCGGTAAVVDQGSDCDDADPNVHPGALETCRDVTDTDCFGGGYVARDSQVDADTRVWIDGDGDGDGHDGDRDGHLCDGAQLPPGWSEGSGDCADDDPEIGPHAVERLCDTVDQDCDAKLTPDVDDGDGDGASCLEDCDDTDPARFPGAVEVCDGVANPCGSTYVDVWFGAPDSDAPDAAMTHGFLDSDQDGYGVMGDPGAWVCPAARDPKTGHGYYYSAATADDCDDQDVDRWPGAPDAVGDGVDQSCDGLDGVDADGDGEAGAGSGGPDCHDTDPFLPASVPICGVTDATCTGAPVDAVCQYSSEVDAGFAGAGAGGVFRASAGDSVGGLAGPDVVLGYWDLTDGATDQLAVLLDETSASYGSPIRFEAPGAPAPGLPRPAWAGGALYGFLGAFDGSGSPVLAAVDTNTESETDGATVWFVTDPTVGGTLPFPDDSPDDPAFVLQAAGARSGYAAAIGQLVENGELDLVVTAPNFAAANTTFWIVPGGSTLPTSPAAVATFTVDDPSLDALGVDAATTPDLGARGALALLSAGIDGYDGTAVVVYDAEDLQGAVGSTDAAPAPIFRYTTGDFLASHQEGPRIVFADLGRDGRLDDLLLLSPHDGTTTLYLIEDLLVTPAVRAVEILEACGGGLAHAGGTVYVGCRQVPNYQGTIFAIPDDVADGQMPDDTPQLRASGFTHNYLGGAILGVDAGANGDGEILASTADGWVLFP